MKQFLKDSHIGNKHKDMPHICQRYVDLWMNIRGNSRINEGERGGWGEWGGGGGEENFVISSWKNR